MVINIKNQEVEAFIREIASATGKDITEIATDLLRQEVVRVRRMREQDLEARRRAIDEASERYAARVGPNSPPIDTIIGYDESGLPT
jgi:hypothetical protein